MSNELPPQPTIPVSQDEIRAIMGDDFRLEINAQFEVPRGTEGIAPGTYRVSLIDAFTDRMLVQRV